MRQQLIPARAFPPGKILQRELEASGLTDRDLAVIDENFPQTIAEIIQGHQQISPEVAMKLSKLLGISAECWLKLENNYRLYLEKKAVEKTPSVSKL